MSNFDPNNPLGTPVDQPNGTTDPALVTSDVPPAQPADPSAPVEQPAPPADDVTPAEPEPVEVGSDPFVVKASDTSEGDRYGIVVGTSDVDYDLPPKADGSVEHVHATHLRVAWFDGSVSQIDADAVERPELS